MGIITAIIILGILVFVHELGHFLVAKFYGVGVLEFAIGFGPVLARFGGTETTYSLRAIPLGGFVRMVGDDPVAVYGESVVGSRPVVRGASPIEGVQEEFTPEQRRMLDDEKRWFLKKSYVPRCAIVLAGPMANFIFALLLGFVTFWIGGVPRLVDGPVTIGGLQKDSPAEQSGLKVGDAVVSVNNTAISSFGELVELIQGSGGKPLSFVIERSPATSEAVNGSSPNKERLNLTVQPVLKEATEEDKVLGLPETSNYRVGIIRDLKNVVYERLGVSAAATAAWQQFRGVFAQNVRGLYLLVSGAISPFKNLGGPIEIVRQTAQSAEHGLMGLLGWAVFLNIALGIMNLVPIPVLDGGHLALFTIEKLRGRPLTLRLQEKVVNVGLIIILTLMVIAVGNDLARVLL